jgi:cytochrome c biogenesis protein CcmG/thiol:disulfide interchange protein DsbE
MRRLALLLALLAVTGCGSDDQAEPSSRPSPSPYLGEDVAAFEAYIKDQRGKPVVVNKWASWCGPCRAEFPFFRSQATKRKGEVVFVGVNSQDNDGNAKRFLGDNPVPFRHFKDANSEIAASFNAVQAFPATAYYTSRGKLEYVHLGGYPSEAKLAEDIDQYAR